MSRGSESDHDGSDVSARLLEFRAESSDSDGDRSLLQEFNEFEERIRLYHNLNGIHIPLR